MEKTITRDQFKKATQWVMMESEFARKSRSPEVGIGGMLAILSASIALSEVEERLFDAVEK